MKPARNFSYDVTPKSVYVTGRGKGGNDGLGKGGYMIRYYNIQVITRLSVVWPDAVVLRVSDGK